MAESLEERLNEARSQDGLLLEFDYLKHLSTTALVALGGALTFLAQPGAEKRPIVAALLLFGYAAAHCFGAMGRIVAHRRFGKPLSRLERFDRLIGTSAFSIGLGILAATMMNLL